MDRLTGPFDHVISDRAGSGFFHNGHRRCIDWHDRSACSAGCITWIAQIDQFAIQIHTMPRQFENRWTRAVVAGKR
jgi:hypothetical protein